jgi:hypothetical protein
MIKSLDHKPTHIRVGQHLFNYLYRNYNPVAESYRAQPLDPFYDDDNVLPLLQDLLQKHVEL